MEERDSLQTLLYSLARLGLFWLISIFASIIGKTAVLGILGTFLPRLALYDNPETLSLFSWIIVLLFLIPLFWDDGKRHTAYGTYNSVLVAIVLILTGATFYIPALVSDYTEDFRAVAAIENIYFTDFWLSKISDDLQVYSLLGTLLNIVVSVAVYVLSHIFYRNRFNDEEE